MRIIPNPTAEKTPGNDDATTEPLILDRRQAARLLDVIGRTTPYKLPLFEAVAAGEIMFCEVPRGAPFPRQALGKIDRPVVAVFGDDDGAATGPAGFPAAPEFADWCGAAMIHAAGGEAAHYATAALATIMLGRYALVETSSRYVDAWCRAFGAGKGAPVLAIRPRLGIHPLPAVLQ